MDTALDTLATIFELQKRLNDEVFARNEVKTTDSELLSMRAIESAVASDENGPNDLPNVWLSKYSQAMRAELDELDQELLWKWWSKDKIDLQNIRVELIDILHFLVSAMMAAGLTSDRVLDLYEQKHRVNLNRQATDYSKANKTEEDNRSVQ